MEEEMIEGAVEAAEDVTPTGKRRRARVQEEPSAAEKLIADLDDYISAQTKLEMVTGAESLKKWAAQAE